MRALRDVARFSDAGTLGAGENLCAPSLRQVGERAALLGEKGVHSGSSNAIRQRWRRILIYQVSRCTVVYSGGRLQ